MSTTLIVDATPMDSAHRTRGLGRYVSNLKDQFVNKNLDCRYLCLHENPASNELRIRRPSKPHVRLQWLWNDLWLPGELTRSGASVYHATDFRGIPRWSCGAVIATAYDLIPWRFKEQTWSTMPADEKYFLKIMEKNYRAADHIIAISESVKEDFIATFSIAPEKITAVPLGYDSRVFRVLSEAERKAAPDIDGPFFLYVGGFDFRKNVPGLLRSFAKIASSVPERLVLVGRRMPQEDQELRALLAELHIEDTVTVFDFLSDAAVVALYNKATAFAFASLYEGFGLPVVEAFACGCPVVCFPAGAVQEVAQKAAIVCADEGEFEEGLVALSRDAAVRNRYVADGLARAGAYSWERCADETRAVYQRFV